VRDPVATLGDLRAQVSACHKGAQRFAELAEHYGGETLTHYADQLMLYTERRVRDEISTWPDGVYEAEGFMDDDGVERGKPVRLHAHVVVDGEGVTVDLTGCASQVRGAINLPHASTHAAVYFAMRSFVGSGIPQNAGATRPISILTRPGSIVQPRSPSPVSVRHITCQRLTDVLLAALSQALPERAIAACHVSFPTFGFGGYDASRDRHALITDILGGGYGAMSGADGLDAVDTYTSNCGILPAEVAELEYPWRIVRTELVSDSGGAGNYRGGLGLRRDYLLLADEAFGNYYVEQTNPDFVPRGLNGGLSGAVALAGLGEGGERSFAEIGGKAVLALRQNDRLVLIGAGGGGYGDPLVRDASLVEADVRDGVVSPRAARELYGVVVADDGRVDADATRSLRADLRERRGVTASVCDNEQ
jgi:N-methylhydantoinase B